MTFRDSSESPAYNFENIQRFVGTEMGVSDWFEITQAETTAFGEVTHDLDLNHIDASWARANSPHGGPIAFGFQTLSLLTYLLKQVGLSPQDSVGEFNYGFDRVRWTAPVAVGARIRARAILAGAQKRTERDYLLKYSVKVEIENSDKPALIAEWLVLFQSDVGERERVSS